MMEHRFPVILGKDFAGTVEAVGDGVTSEHVGDEVFGVLMRDYVGDGTFADSRPRDRGCSWTRRVGSLRCHRGRRPVRGGNGPDRRRHGRRRCDRHSTRCRPRR
jgi:hypothetical protein